MTKDPPSLKLRRPGKIQITNKIQIVNNLKFMKNTVLLPVAETYKKEFKYFPWGILIKKIFKLIVKKVPKNGSVLDLLCGPGYLLGEIKKKRRDVNMTGVDISKNYIDYAKSKYPGIKFFKADVLKWKTSNKYDLILCTGGLHHIPYQKQGILIKKICEMLKMGGIGIAADPYIDNYKDEQSRQIAAAKLGYEYLAATIKNKAPRDVVKAASDIIINDVTGVEYKSAIKKVIPLIKKSFTQVEIHKTWPAVRSGYGDYYIIVKK